MIKSNQNWQIGERLKIYFSGQWIPGTIVTDGQSLLIVTDHKAPNNEFLNGHGFIVGFLHDQKKSATAGGN